MAPNLFQDFPALHYGVWFGAQHFKELDFAVRKLARRLSIQTELLAFGPKKKAAQSDSISVCNWGGQASFGEIHQILDAHDEFFLAERLAEIVVAAGIKALKHVFCLTFGSQKNDGHLRIKGADFFPYGEAVAVG